MARLIAKTPAEGLLPVTHGAVTLDEALPEAITSVTPLRGQDGAVARALGQPLPGPGETTTGAAGELVWTGRGQAMLLGPAPGAVAGAAITDQSDAWAVLVLTGPGAADVLARLVPADLRDAAFAVGATARTLVGHMPASLTRTGAEAWRIMVFRAMARTAVHELSEAMRTVAARRA